MLGRPRGVVPSGASAAWEIGARGMTREQLDGEGLRVEREIRVAEGAEEILGGTEACYSKCTAGP